MQERPFTHSYTTNSPAGNAEITSGSPEVAEKLDKKDAIKKMLGKITAKLAFGKKPGESAPSPVETPSTAYQNEKYDVFSNYVPPQELSSFNAAETNFLQPEQSAGGSEQLNGQGWQDFDDLVDDDFLFNAPTTEIPIIPQSEDAPLSVGKQKQLEAQKRLDQIIAENSYSIEVDPSAAHADLSSEEIRSRFEVDRVVKTAPTFAEQLNDDTRTNKIQHIAKSHKMLGTITSAEGYVEKRTVMTEGAAIRETAEFLATVAGRADVFSNERREVAQGMLDNMTFIGEREYKEATSGIATYWKEVLETNPDLQILALAGEVAKSNHLFEGPNGEFQVKSDDYLLDNILSNFSEDELEKYGSRLILDERDVTADKPEDLKVVLLDDWTISGQQLMTARDKFLDRRPGFEGSVEVQLIAANNDRITRGLTHNDYFSPVQNRISTPVRAYYRAHAAPETGRSSAAHITGSHSSVDYDFEMPIGSMIAEGSRVLNEEYINPTDDLTEDPDLELLSYMPPLTNIVRPYRNGSYTNENTQRLRTIRSKVNV